MSQQDFSPEKLIMDANIKEFGYRISMICALESGGKITQEEAYLRIKETWHSLKSSRQNLREDAPPQH